MHYWEHPYIRICALTALSNVIDIIYLRHCITTIECICQPCFTVYHISKGENCYKWISEWICWMPAGMNYANVDSHAIINNKHSSVNHLTTLNSAFHEIPL